MNRNIYRFNNEKRSLSCLKHAIGQKIEDSEIRQEWFQLQENRMYYYMVPDKYACVDVAASAENWWRFCLNLPYLRADGTMREDA